MRREGGHWRGTLPRAQRAQQGSRARGHAWEQPGPIVSHLPRCSRRRSGTRRQAPTTDLSPGPRPSRANPLPAPDRSARGVTADRGGRRGGGSQTHKTNAFGSLWRERARAIMLRTQPHPYPPPHTHTHSVHTPQKNTIGTKQVTTGPPWARPAPVQGSGKAGAPAEVSARSVHC
jgi:hypothetical protein